MAQGRFGRMEYFVSLERALELAKQVSVQLDEEEIILDDAHERYLSRSLKSKVDDPPFDNSSMDGFAVHHLDTLTPPVRLEIIGVSQAAAISEELVVEKGQAAQIMTGAPIPLGSNAIIMVEKTKTSTDGKWVEILAEAKPGFIRKKGENLEKGVEALHAGSKLSHHRLGLAATMGYLHIPVYKKLKVAIISTGDELKQPGEELQSGEIYESNSFGLAGLVKELNCIPIRYPACVDSLDKLRSALDTAAVEADIILTSGGVSMGEWDLVRKIMEEEGDIHFWRVKIRPGSPPIFGTWKGTPIFGLPGNPVSSHVVFRMLTRPWILEQMGAKGPHETIVPVKLLEDVKATSDCHTLRRVSIYKSDEGMVASMKTHQGSGNLHSLVAANALTYLQPGSTAKAGETIDVILL